MKNKKESQRNRWHPLAMFAALISLTTFILANVAGSPLIGPDVFGSGQYGPHFNCYEQGLLRGWPLTYATYELPPVPMLAPSQPVSAWKFGERTQFVPISLASNLFICLISAFFIGWVINRHIRNFGWRFRIIHLLTAMLFLAICLAYGVNRSKKHVRQLEYIQNHANGNAMYEGQLKWEPFGPYWLRQLTGEEFWKWGDLVTEISIDRGEDIEKIPEKSSIKAITFSDVSIDRMHALAEFRNLVAIDMSQANWGYYAPLDHLDPNGDVVEPPFWPCLREVAQVRSLQVINLYDIGIQDRDLQELSNMPNLQRIELSANYEITDAGLQHLHSIKSLRMLGLSGTSVTKEGIEALSKALPNCKVSFQ